MIYSLIETAKGNSLNPYRYLLWVLSNAPGLAQSESEWAEKLTPAAHPQNAERLNKFTAIEKTL